MTLLSLACGAMTCVTGCPGTLDDKELFLRASLGDASGGETGTGGGTGGCPDVPAEVFIPSCGISSCHGAKSPQQGLDLASPGVASRVVGIPSKECRGLLADPPNPTSSVIYTKLLAGVTCGAQMPLARPSLGPATIDCIKTWITAQAPGGMPASDAGAMDSSTTDM